MVWCTWHLLLKSMFQSQAKVIWQNSKISNGLAHKCTLFSLIKPIVGQFAAFFSWSG